MIDNFNILMFIFLRKSVIYLYLFHLSFNKLPFYLVCLTIIFVSLDFLFFFSERFDVS